MSYNNAMQLAQPSLAHLRTDLTVGGSEWAGSVKLGSYSWKELALRDIIVTSPEHLGSHVVFKAKSISLHPSWSIFKGLSSILQHLKSPVPFYTALCSICFCNVSAVC